MCFRTTRTRVYHLHSLEEWEYITLILSGVYHLHYCRTTGVYTISTLEYSSSTLLYLEPSHKQEYTTPSLLEYTIHSLSGRTRMRVYHLLEYTVSNLSENKWNGSISISSLSGVYPCLVYLEEVGVYHLQSLEEQVNWECTIFDISGVYHPRWISKKECIQSLFYLKCTVSILSQVYSLWCV